MHNNKALNDNQKTYEIVGTFNHITSLTVLQIGAGLFLWLDRHRGGSTGPLVSDEL